MNTMIVCSPVDATIYASSSYWRIKPLPQGQCKRFSQSGAG
ncbi:hypothetical protein BDIM_14120 [Brevundimonas diminuta ATCC 11568]|nr:hypothetical protein BDIM_14120 [Brevundimonas diminuta ATCC 11568]